MNYIHLKCIIIISNNVYLANKFLPCFWKFWKNDYSTHIKLCPIKNYIKVILLKQTYCMQNFVRFHIIESEIELQQKFWEKMNNGTPYWAICTRFASLLYLMMCTYHVNFCPISSSRNLHKLIPKIPGKVSLQRYLLSDFYQKLRDISLC